MTYFIAEVSSNHQQDLERCEAFIRCSAAIGCDAVKFQLFKIDQLFAPEILRHSPPHRQRQQWELPEQYIPRLAEYCKEQRIDFSCTPFYLDAVELLAEHVAFFKIASYELLWSDLLRACAQTGKPVVLSSGMATLNEIDDALETLSSAGAREIALLHCVSAYPAPEEECNLSAIDTLRQRYDVPIGWSDHSHSEAVLYRAVHRWQADYLEFHLDLDSQGAEYSSGHCWLPEKISPIIQSARRADIIDGGGEKIPAASELPDRGWRADSEDGLRPTRAQRREFIKT